MCRNCHHCTSSVACQHVVCHPDLDFLTVERIDRIRTCECSGNGFYIAHSLALRAIFGHLDIGFCSFPLIISDQFGRQVRFRCQRQIGYPVNGIYSGGEHFDFFIRTLHIEKYFCADRFTDPIALHFFDGLRPVHFFQTLKQAIGIGRNPHGPLHHLFSLHRMAASFGESVFHFVVRKHGSQSRTPVYGGLSKESQSVFKQHFLLFFFRKCIPFRCAKSWGVVITHRFDFRVSFFFKSGNKRGD